jgi:hypothetical protein
MVLLVWGCLYVCDGAIREDLGMGDQDAASDDEAAEPRSAAAERVPSRPELESAITRLLRVYITREAPIIWIDVPEAAASLAPGLAAVVDVAPERLERVGRDHVGDRGARDPLTSVQALSAAKRAVAQLRADRLWRRPPDRR